MRHLLMRPAPKGVRIIKRQVVAREDQVIVILDWLIDSALDLVKFSRRVEAAKARTQASKARKPRRQQRGS